MRTLLAYLLTPIHLFFFGLALLIFHPIQWLGLKIGGYPWQKKAVDYLNFFAFNSLWLLAIRPKFNLPYDLPRDRPLIVVANHQSLYDIPAFFWKLRAHHVKFVSKIELAKGIPSISFNLRHGGNALIDRKNPRQAIPALKAFAEYIEENKYCACIFPEGTRSRTGAPKEFSPRGFQILMKYAPSALIIPVTINNSWRITPRGWFPLGVGFPVSWDFHPPIEPAGRSSQEVLQEAEAMIKGNILTT